jgi:hypothetical protein
VQKKSKLGVIAALTRYADVREDLTRQLARLQRELGDAPHVTADAPGA